MVDGKMVSILQGDSGSFCHFCTCTRREANDVINILKEFPINKAYDDMVEIWDKVEAGLIKKTSREKNGQCHKPMLGYNILVHGVLHSKLRKIYILKMVSNCQDYLKYLKTK